MAKSRKQVYDEFIQNGGSSNYTKPHPLLDRDSTFIGNVNTEANGEAAGNFATPAPPSPENLRYKNNINTLDKYFGSRDISNFKFGLERGTYVDNLDEDPIIFGFDLMINHMTSPLYSAYTEKSPFTGDLESFFKFAKDNSLVEVTNRRPIYEEFMNQLEVIFLTTNVGKFDTFRAHYLTGIDGLDKLIEQNSGIVKGKQFAKYGEDRISLKLTEDVHLNSGYLAHLYKTMSYNKLTGKMIIPDNLLKFDCSIIVSEVRNFNLVKKALNSDNVAESIQVFNDNVSRYIYNLYECQFMFDTMSHGSTIDNSAASVKTDTYDISFIYKYSNLMMEKFKLSDESGNQARFFVNNAGIDPTRNLQGGLNSSASGSDGFGSAKAFGYNYNLNDNPYKDLSSITSNGIIQNLNVSYDAEREALQDLKANSEVTRREAISQGEANRKSEASNNPNNKPLGKESVSGYSKEDRRSDSDIGGDFADVFKKTGNYALAKIKNARDKLINDTLQNIRQATGLKRINKPTNVYDDNSSIPGFLRNQLSNFANDQVTDFLSGLND
jgi:hypothetical protein